MFLKINKCFHLGDDSFTAEPLTCEKSVRAVSRWMCLLLNMTVVLSLITQRIEILLHLCSGILTIKVNPFEGNIQYR